MAADPVLLIIGLLLIFLLGGTLGLVLGIVCIVLALGHGGYGFYGRRRL